jgi:hypothetical protein
VDVCWWGKSPNQGMTDNLDSFVWRPSRTLNVEEWNRKGRGGLTTYGSLADLHPTSPSRWVSTRHGAMRR